MSANWTTLISNALLIHIEIDSRAHFNFAILIPQEHLIKILEHSLTNIFDYSNHLPAKKLENNFRSGHYSEHWCDSLESITFQINGMELWILCRWIKLPNWQQWTDRNAVDSRDDFKRIDYLDTRNDFMHHQIIMGCAWPENMHVMWTWADTIYLPSTLHLISGQKWIFKNSLIDCGCDCDCIHLNHTKWFNWILHDQINHINNSNDC